MYRKDSHWIRNRGISRTLRHGHNPQSHRQRTTWRLRRHDHRNQQRSNDSAKLLRLVARPSQPALDMATRSEPSRRRKAEILFGRRRRNTIPLLPGCSTAKNIRLPSRLCHATASCTYHPSVFCRSATSRDVPLRRPRSRPTSRP